MSCGVRMIQTPIVSLKRSSTPIPYSAGKPTLNCAGGSLMTLGNMKRPVAASAATEAAVNAPQATPIQARRDISGEVSSSSAPAAAAAGFFAGAPTTGDVTLPARSAGGTAGAAGRGGTAGRGCAPAAGAAAAGGAGRGAVPGGAVPTAAAGRGAAAGRAAAPAGAAGRCAMPPTALEAEPVPTASPSAGICDSVTPDFVSSAMPLYSFLILDSRFVFRD